MRARKVDQSSQHTCYFSLALPIFLAWDHHLETFESRIATTKFPFLSLLISMLIYTLALYCYVSSLISCLLAISLDYVGSMSPPKNCLCFRLPTRGRAWTKLGMLIRPKRIYNFYQFHALFITLLHFYLHFHIFYNISWTNLLIQCPVPVSVCALQWKSAN